MVSLLIKDSPSKAKEGMSPTEGGPHHASKTKKANQELIKCLSITSHRETVVKSYSCAWQKDILVHGKLHMTENWICFYSSILGWETKTSINLKDVTSITKQKTALFFPNAILVETTEKKYGFSSFMHRDRAYQIMHAIWGNFNLHKPFTGEAFRQHLKATCRGRHDKQNGRPAMQSLSMQSLSMEDSSDPETANIPPCCSLTTCPTPSSIPHLSSPCSLHSDSLSDTQTCPSANTSSDWSEASLEMNSVTSGETDLCDNDAGGVRTEEHSCTSSSSNEDEEEGKMEKAAATGLRASWSSSDSGSNGDGSGSGKELDSPSLFVSASLVTIWPQSKENEGGDTSTSQVTCHNKSSLKLHSVGNQQQQQQHHHRHHHWWWTWKEAWEWTTGSTWPQTLLHLFTSTRLINTLILLFILVLLLSMVSMLCQLCRLDPSLQPYMVWQPWCTCITPHRASS